MGKRLEDLDLGDSGPARRDDLARSRREADQAVESILEMLAPPYGTCDDDRYGFAFGTLIDLKVGIEKAGRVTERQLQAIQNIRAGGDRQAEMREGWEQHERRTGRRYEGFNDPYRR